jgi:hypothetical protein
MGGGVVDGAGVGVGVGAGIADTIPVVSKKIAPRAKA